MALYGNYRMIAAVGERVKQDCLIGQKSILTGEVIWTQENFQELYRLYNENLDESNRTFDVKVQDQLQQASSPARQLFAELYIIDLLVLGNILPKTKIQKINAVLEKCDPSTSLDGEDAPPGAVFIVETFRTGGVLNGGQGFNMGRWRQMQYLIDFGCAWNALPADQRTERMSSTEGIEDSLYNLASKNEPQIIYALSYILDPRSHAPIASRKTLTQIVTHFEGRLQDEERDYNPQRKASIIRDRIREERGADWDFYDDSEEWSASEKTAAEVVATVGSHEPEVAERASSTVDEPFHLPDFPEQTAELLLVDEEWLANVHRTLDRRKQIIFQGPPGTGKTYLARRIALRLAGSSDRVALVQFHPAYTYEDFFEGFRPGEEGGLHLRQGPLRRLAERAESEPELPFFLIVDEMNRGNLPRIFGELYFLLEYRDHRLDLMYSQEKFTLPNNLFIIGTMNSADRSVALVDAAMRRRFAFIDLEPFSAPTRDLLSRWCAQHGVDQSVVTLWTSLNERIQNLDPEALLGPTYFMRDWVYTEDGLRDLWRTEIMPQLRESLYGSDATSIEGLELEVLLDDSGSLIE